jgi:hypothetical protein
LTATTIDELLVEGRLEVEELVVLFLFLKGLRQIPGAHEKTLPSASAHGVSVCSTQADIFVLGAVLYEMATGKRAFAGKTQASLIAAILASEPQRTWRQGLLLQALSKSFGSFFWNSRRYFWNGFGATFSKRFATAMAVLCCFAMSCNNVYALNPPGTNWPNIPVTTTKN